MILHVSVCQFLPDPADFVLSNVLPPTAGFPWGAAVSPRDNQKSASSKSFPNHLNLALGHPKHRFCVICVVFFAICFDNSLDLSWKLPKSFLLHENQWILRVRHPRNLTFFYQNSIKISCCFRDPLLDLIFSHFFEIWCSNWRFGPPLKSSRAQKSDQNRK